MLKLSHKKMIIISGAIWLAIGFWLMSLGLNFLQLSLKQSINQTDPTPLLNVLKSVFKTSDMSAIAIVVVSLTVGFFKGRVVLGKSVRKGVGRILAMPNPMSLAQIYSSKYYMLLGLMVGLGMSLKFFGLPYDVRSFVDMAIGSALMNGAMLYFREAYASDKRAT